MLYCVAEPWDEEANVETRAACDWPESVLTNSMMFVVTGVDPLTAPYSSKVGVAVAMVPTSSNSTVYPLCAQYVMANRPPLPGRAMMDWPPAAMRLPLTERLALAVRRP